MNAAQAAGIVALLTEGHRFAIRSLKDVRPGKTRLELFRDHRLPELQKKQSEVTREDLENLLAWLRELAQFELKIGVAKMIRDQVNDAEALLRWIDGRL